MYSQGQSLPIVPANVFALWLLQFSSFELPSALAAFGISGCPFGLA